MKRVSVRNTTRSVKLVEHGQFAGDLWHRFVGLMGVSELHFGEGLLLHGEQAIHTFGMKISIDVAYLDERGLVLRILHSMPPGRFGPFVWKSRDILELPAGVFTSTGTREGDQLEIKIG